MIVFIPIKKFGQQLVQCILVVQIIDRYHKPGELAYKSLKLAQKIYLQFQKRPLLFSLLLNLFLHVNIFAFLLIAIFHISVSIP